MRLIRMIELRDGGGRQFGLFRCEHCGKEVQRLKFNGLRNNSCGCRRWVDASPEKKRKNAASYRRNDIATARMVSEAKDRARERTEPELRLLADILRIVGA